MATTSTGSISGSVSGSAAGSAAGSAPSSPDSLTSTLSLGHAALSQLEPAQRLRTTLWQQFASLLVPCVTRVVEFAKRVPGEAPVPISVERSFPSFLTSS